MSPDLEGMAVSQVRASNGQTWAEVHVELRFADLKEPPPSMIVHFPYGASEELSNSPEEVFELILKVAGDRLILLLRDAAAELERKPLAVGGAYIVRGPPPAR